MIKKVLSILTMLIIAIAMLSSCAKADPSSESPVEESVAEEKQRSILFLGDSIGEAIAGTTPLTEREAYGYYGIIGNINGFDYHNRAVTGHTTQDLLDLVQREDDGINMVHSLIAGADIIHISIAGNDFLYSNHADMILGIANGDYTLITPRQETATENIDKTLKVIREINPNATILVQTLYNPGGPDNALFTNYTRNKLAAKGYAPSDYHEILGLLVDEINKIILNYYDEHTVTAADGTVTHPFELIDVHAAFEKIYRDEPTRWEKLFCDDGVHTINEGHAVTAECLQEKLTELGFAAPNAIHNYKRDKVAQLERLYPEATDKESIKSAIMRSTTFGEVSLAYFGGTRNYLPHCELGRTTGKTFSETQSFEVTLAKIGGREITGLLDKDKAHVTFYADGSYELYLPLNEIAIGSLKYLIADSGGIDFNHDFSFGLVPAYFPNICPGVDPTDLKAILQAIEDIYGISVIGIDYDAPCTIEMLEKYRDTERLVMTDPDVLKNEVAFKCVGSYHLEKVTAKDGTVYDAIYVNNSIGRSESFVRYTYTKDEYGFKYVRMTIDVVKIELEGELYEP